MSAEEFRIAVILEILWIILNIKIEKSAIVDAIRELKREVDK